MINFTAINEKIDILVLLGLQGVKPASTTNGGEFKTACPACGGHDRFSVWPNHPKGARAWCRGCDRSFDAIDLYKYLHNLDTKTAVQELEGKPVVIDRQDHCLANEKTNLDKWNTTAAKLCNQWHEDLWNIDNSAALQWLIKRGLGETAIVENNLGFNDKDLYLQGDAWGLDQDKKVFMPRGITIPNTGHYVTIRRSVNKGDKYHKVAGSRGFLFVAGGSYDHTIGYLFESELDAILASQSGFDAGYFSLPAGQNLKSEYNHYFDRMEALIICMDNDQPGQAAASKHLQIAGTIASDPLPGDCKDITEYFQKTNMDAVTTWLLDQAEKIEGKQWT